ncbi:MAG: RNA polymerase sigma-54 factor [Candidatus Tectomicrobia bacterium RIFCSPLOWO2_02_FULL_70_19]|nr:MAG: RNA polymerase sigma-54 factor [Candidatus Tectomicrobia bacterium RIFCSPLOWO2_02_FULL_70_19]
MALQPRLTLKTEQRLVMTAMLQQAISLLPLTRLELQQAVQQELLENPVLEEALDESKEVADGDMPEAPEEVPSTETDERGEVEIDWGNIIQDDYTPPGQAGLPPEEGDFPSYEQTLSRPESLREHLEWQLQLSPAPAPVRRVAEQIVGNIDEAGYLQADPQEIAALEGLGEAEAARALALVQEFDPAGVGARDLRECLLLQLRSLERDGLTGPEALGLALQLVRGHLEMLEERHHPRLARQLGVEAEEIQAAVRLVRALNPRPGERFTEQRVEVVVPDVTVIRRGEDYDIVLNDDGLPPLRLSPFYTQMAADRGATPADARRFIEERVRAAVWFLKSIEQRRQTILKVSRSIVSFQRDFLDHGVSHLRPLVLRDVAEDIEMHESTVSRVTTGKYMETPRGVFPFKYFFHSGLASTDGNSASSVAVKEKIRRIVEAEDKRRPLTDQQIVEKLRDAQILIARRTVTKYRKELRLASAGRRRQAAPKNSR